MIGGDAVEIDHQAGRDPFENRQQPAADRDHVGRDPVGKHRVDDAAGRRRVLLEINDVVDDAPLELGDERALIGRRRLGTFELLAAALP